MGKSHKGPAEDFDVRPTVAGQAVALFTETVSSKRDMQLLKNPGATTTSLVGLLAAPTDKVAGTVATADDNDGPLRAHPTTATLNQAAGFLSAFTLFQRNWEVEFIATLKTDPSLLTLSRYWAGLFSADPSASATPAVHLAGFRYDTAADGTAFWRCCTAAAATLTVTVTTVAIAANTKYLLRLVCNNTTGDVKFYINDVLVATHSTNLPTATQLLGFGITLTTLSAAIRTVKWGRVAIRHN